jgi:hypothetical protein
VDAEGRLLVANPGLGYVWVLNDRAEPVQVMRGVPAAPSPTWPSAARTGVRST